MIPVALTSTSVIVASMVTIVLTMVFTDRRLSLASLSAYFAIIGLTEMGALDWRIALLKLITGQTICLILLFTSLRITRETHLAEGQATKTTLTSTVHWRVARDSKAILAPLSRTTVLVFSLTIAYSLAQNLVTDDSSKSLFDRQGPYTAEVVAFGSVAGGLIALVLFRTTVKTGIGLILMATGVDLFVLSQRPTAIFEFLATSTIVEVLLGLTVAYLDAHIALPEPTRQESASQTLETSTVPKG